MKQFLSIIFLWQMTVALVLGASVKAKVSDSNVIEGNSVRLTLEASGDDVIFPVISTIGLYPVESTSNTTQSSLKIVNGTVTQESIKRFILTFTPEHTMTIPSFKIKVNGESMKTDPIDIKIVKSVAPTPGAQQKVSLSMRVNKKKVYVGEPILLTVFFNESNRVDLMKVEYHKPETKDFFIKSLGDEKTYRKGDYLVHELRYLLTPKFDGNFSIAPVRAKVAERGQRRDDFFGTFFDTPIWSNIISNGLNIEVKPSPEDTDLIGDLTLSDQVDATKVKANKPVNLTIKISGEGNLEDFEGPQYEIDGVTIYSDDAKIQSQLIGDKLISSYEKKFVFIADHDFTIPSRSFSLFDFKTGEVKRLKTESHAIAVKGGKAIAPAVIQSTSAQSPAAKVKKSNVHQAVATKIQNPSSASISEWMLILAFIGGILITLGVVKILPLLQWRKAANPMKESEAIKILYPHTSDDPKVEEMVRKLYAKRGGDKRVVIDKASLKVLVDHYKVS